MNRWSPTGTSGTEEVTRWIRRLERALPAHSRLAARDAVQALAERLAPARRPVHLAAAEALAALAQEHEALAAAARSRSEALRAAPTEQARRQLLTELLGRGPGAAADLRALDRWLDAEAVEDRDRFALHGLWQQRALLATALTGWLRGDNVVALGPALVEALVDLGCGALADAREPWQVRVAFAGLLGAVGRTPLAQVASPDTTPAASTAAQALRERAQDHEAPPWVQVAALEAWVALRAAGGDEVESALAAVLLPDEVLRRWLSADHALVRARAARLCGAHHLWGLAHAVLQGPEPSEHVRIAAVRALAAEPGVGRLRRWLRTVEGDDKVVGAALVASLPDVGREGREGWIKEVATALSGPRPWVARLLVQALLDRRRHLTGLPWGLLETRWAPALDALACGEDDDPAESAGLLRRWLAVQADEEAREALAVLDRWVDGAEEGEAHDFREGPLADLDPERLLQVMCVAAAEGFDLSADPVPGGYRLYCGGILRTQPWRVLHELATPAPDKRQAHPHTVDDLPPGALLAPSRLLAEVTPTRVPGRRVATTETLSWGADLPLPSQLLAASRRPRTELVTPRHRLTLRREGSALGSWARVQRRYIALSDLRERQRARGRGGLVAYDRAVEALGLTVQRRSLPGVPELLLLAGEAVQHDLNTLFDLALWGGLVIGAWTARQYWIGRDVARDRAAVPLVVGGWGSRGKSGTERLKAGLFHGLGYRVVAKTTGCEAMFIASVPGADPVEVFLFRPYDKATIVEQRDVLRMAARLRAQVMTWECMALRPAFVEILQRQWMRDDLSTLTNTYPDHEDIQGPSGRDVADTIARFIPRGGVALHTERHMRPVLHQEARRAGTRIQAVRPETWELLPEDLLARFPYQEHPRNIALVLCLARELEVEDDQALALMADCVVPDLGVLKEYGPAPFKGRTVSFVNGCSANERAGFLSNWRRMGLGDYDEGSGLTHRLVVVFNNRADRLARQQAFTRIALLDTAADAIVLIGTNVGSFAVEYREGLRKVLAPSVRGELGEGGEAWERLVERVERLLRRRPMPREEALQRAVSFAGEGHELEEAAAQAWSSPLKVGRLVGHRLEAGAPEPVVAAAQWLREVAFVTALAEGPVDVDRVIEGLVAILEARLVPLMEPALTGDQVLHRVVCTAAEGCTVRILGAENIKGTGLDFVYRWVGLDTVQGLLNELMEADAPHAARAALTGLADHPDYGLMEVGVVLEALLPWMESGKAVLLGLRSEAEALVGTLKARQQRLEGELTAGQRGGGMRRAAVGIVEAALDSFDSVRRRKRADRLYRDLAARRVGIRRAAAVAKKLTTRQKGGWLGKEG